MSVQEDIARLESLLRTIPKVSVKEDIVDNCTTEFCIELNDELSEEEYVVIRFEHSRTECPTIQRISWNFSEDLFSRFSLYTLPRETHDRLFNLVTSMHEKYLESSRSKTLDYIEENYEIKTFA